MDVLEIHTWNSRAGSVDRPDRLVIDLDPGPQASWAEVVAAAHDVRAALRAERLASWVKTTGGAGLHHTLRHRRRLCGNLHQHRHL